MDELTTDAAVWRPAELTLCVSEQRDPASSADLERQVQARIAESRSTSAALQASSWLGRCRPHPRGIG